MSLNHSEMRCHLINDSVAIEHVTFVGQTRLARCEYKDFKADISTDFFYSLRVFYVVLLAVKIKVSKKESMKYSF